MIFISRFLSYNTDDPTTGQTPLAGNASITIGPMQVGGASKLVGSCFSDTAGTLLVQQSFNYSQSISFAGTSTSTGNWDVSQSFAVTGGTPLTIDVDVIAPAVQLIFTNGATANAHLRIFARVYGPGK